MGRVVDAVKNAREFLLTSFFGRELVAHFVASMACSAAHWTVRGAVRVFGPKLGRARSDR